MPKLYVKNVWKKIESNFISKSTGVTAMSKEEQASD